jgi:galactitol-specific phosphotransferase system IIB component
MQKDYEYEISQNQLQKYNDDFKHYFACTKSMFNKMNHTAKKARRLIATQINDTTQKQQQKKLKSMHKFHSNHEEIITALKLELKNLQRIVDYLKEKQPMLKSLAQTMKYEEENTFSSTRKTYVAKIFVLSKELDKNISFSKNYIIPKMHVTLEKNQALNNKLDKRLYKIKQQNKNSKAQTQNTNPTF